MASRAPPPSAVRASWSAAAPRAIASPCCAARRRAPMSSTSPGRSLAAAISPASWSSRSSRRATSRGSMRRGVEQVAVLPPALDGRRHRRPQVVVTAPAIEQVPLPALVEQSPLVVLPVDLDERPDVVRETRRRDGRVVETRRGPPRGRDLAHRDQRLRCAVEQGLDPGQLGPVPDERRVRTRAEGETERIDEQALAGARLPGDDVEPGLEARSAAGRSGRGR